MNHVKRHKKKYQAGGIAAVLIAALRVILADPNVQCWLNEDACQPALVLDAVDGGAQ